MLLSHDVYFFVIFFLKKFLQKIFFLLVDFMIYKP
jgi:hypothetical protein